MTHFHLAQINIAKMLVPIDSQLMKDFVDNFERINSIAVKEEGFIWRLKDENYNATSIKVFDNDFLVINMSVWEPKESLFKFTQNSSHVEILTRKKEWFHKIEAMHMALCYVLVGHSPIPEETKERLNYLDQHGETPYSFLFKSHFTTAELGNFKLLPRK